jgi:hypothetical protein
VGPDLGPPGGVFEGAHPSADVPHHVESDGDDQPAWAIVVAVRLAAWHCQFLLLASPSALGF